VKVLFAPDHTPELEIMKQMLKGSSEIVEVAGRTFAFSTQADAEVVGRQVARAEKLEFLLHGADGVVRNRLAYGGDTSRCQRLSSDFYWAPHDAPAASTAWANPR
jgi:uncharacterized protein DUF2188